MTASLDQPALHRLTASAASLPRREQAAFVQTAVNRAIRNLPFRENCSDDGYWAPAGETLGRGMGDCFDIAVAKMEALRLLGVPKEDLYLTTGYFGSGLGHGRVRESAALLVKIETNFWLLTDELAPLMDVSASSDAFVEFTPVLTYGLGRTWVHGQLVNAASPDETDGNAKLTG